MWKRKKERSYALLHKQNLSVQGHAVLETRAKGAELADSLLGGGNLVYLPVQVSSVPPTLIPFKISWDLQELANYF